MKNKENSDFLDI